MHDSSYYDVIAVCDSLSKAQAVLGTSEHDFIHNLEREESLSIEDKDFSIENINIEEEDMQLTITDESTGMFDKYTITEIEVC